MYRKHRLHLCAIFGSLKDRWFLTHFLEVPYCLKVPCIHFQVSSMSGSPSVRPKSTISRLNPWRANGPRRTSWKFLVASRCYISNFRSLGCQEAHQEGSYTLSPGWILRGLGCFLYTIELVSRNARNWNLKCQYAFTVS